MRRIIGTALAASVVLCACSDDDSGQNNANDNQNNNTAARCGNGMMEGVEECDHGTDNSDTRPNACRTDCTLPTCGDYVVDTGYLEECDDGPDNSDTEPNACRADCTSPFCGDGVIDDQLGEECDDANSASGDGCGPTCLIEACGNGYLDPGEECDDTNDATGDGCGPTCLREECGNGYLDTAIGEVCDAGPYNSQAPDATCRLDCQPARCGDGVRDSGEECDHGLANSDTLPDACRTDCVNPTCGDGVRDATEACDDGDHEGGDGCSADCLSDETCGNGVLDTIRDEVCDAGPYNSWLANAPCRPTCLEPDCGDGVVDGALDEVCDDGLANSDVAADACRSDCQPARCGDGVIDTNENCDDSNPDRGDGCSDRCLFEYGWNCNPQPPHDCQRCPDYFHGASCDQCAVLVDLNSPTAFGDGTSWFTAFRTVQDGIDQANSLVTTGGGPASCDVWVARGNYNIYKYSPSDTVRLRANVPLYGGFMGTETARDQRDWENNRTVLDGSDGQYTSTVYHVVSIIDTQDAYIDGFVVSGGVAAGPDEKANGGGIYNQESTVTVVNCTIANNIAAGEGGGAYISSDSAPGSIVVQDSIFSANSADNGGAIDARASNGTTAVTVSNCRFFGNSASEGGGAIDSEARGTSGQATVDIFGSTFSANSASYGGGLRVYNTSGVATATITDSTFTTNTAVDGGGVYSYADALYDGTDTTTTLANCLLSGNRATRYGGGIYSRGAYSSANGPANAVLDISACTFSANESVSSGGGIYSYAGWDAPFATVDVTSSTFSANIAGSDGGGIYSYANNDQATATANVSSCVFTANYADLGGGIYSRSGSETSIAKTYVSASAFVANSAVYGGAMLNDAGSDTASTTTEIASCTLSANSADEGGGIYNMASAGTVSVSALITGSIIWSNSDTSGASNPSIFNDGSTATSTVTYSDIEDGHAGTGNLDTDPDFVAGQGTPLYEGFWDAFDFDEQTGRTTLRQSNHTFTPDALIGLFVQPMTGTGNTDPRWFLITANDSQSLQISGDLGRILAAPPDDPGNPYDPPFGANAEFSIFDLHLQPTSSCIDAGSGCTDSATCNPLVPLTDLEDNSRHDAAQTNIYECNTTPEPQCFEYVDMGAYEWQPL